MIVELSRHREPILPAVQSLDLNDVARVGLGYTLEVPELGIHMSLNRVRVHSDSINGYLTVRTPSLEGVKTFRDGILMVGSINILGPTTRKAWVTELKARTKAFDIDWGFLLAYFAERVTASEMGGPAIERTGTQKLSDNPESYAIDVLAPKNVATILFAPGGSGKSQTALALALSVQMGRQILPPFAPMMRAPVLYLDWETDSKVIANRIQRICRGLNIPPVDIAYRHCVRPLADDVETLTLFVEREGIEFIVVDSAGPAMGEGSIGGDSSETAMRLFDALRVLGGTALVVDHVAKQDMRGGKDARALPYGSIFKINRARSAWNLKPVQTLPDESLVVAFHHVKSNDSRLAESIGMRIGFANSSPTSTTFHEWSGDIDAEEQEPRTSPVNWGTKEKILDAQDPGTWVTPAAMASMIGVDRGTVHQTYKRGVKAGWAIARGDGMYTVRGGGMLK